MKVKDYFKPKSLIYTGNKTDVKTTINQYHYQNKHFKHIDGTKDLKEADYIQVIGLNDLNALKVIQDTFEIDPFIMEDILNVKQRNKIEYGESYIFSCFAFLSKDDQIKKHYMSLYINKDVLLTFHETDPIALEPLKVLMDEFHDLKQNKSDFMFYQILDLVTDDHLDILEALELKMSEFEEKILETKAFNEQSFYLLRKQILQLKNMTSPLYEDLKKGTSMGHTLIESQTLYYMNDLLDHMHRLDLRLNHLKDLMRTLLDLDMNHQSTKMNKIMSTLTLFSAIFIPLSFLTGFFGMNFIHFDLLSYEHAIIVFSVVCISIALGMLLIFKKNKWF